MKYLEDLIYGGVSMEYCRILRRGALNVPSCKFPHMFGWMNPTLRMLSAEEGNAE
jgi:hypothetical protein